MAYGDTLLNFANNKFTRLTGAHAAGATTLTVTSTSGFPTAPFGLLVGGGTANAEWVICSAIADATHFTVGALANSHGDQAMVSNTVDATGLGRLVAFAQQHTHTGTTDGLALPYSVLTFSGLTTDHVWRATGATAASFGTLGTASLATNAVSKTQLHYTASSDVANGVAVSSATWTNLGSDQSFTVDTSTNDVYFLLNVGCRLQCAAAAAIAGRLFIDSGNSQLIGGGFAGTNYLDMNPFAGGGSARISNMSAGSHTVRPQVYIAGTTGTLYCRASSQAPVEHLSLIVLEVKK